MILHFMVVAYVTNSLFFYHFIDSFKMIISEIAVEYLCIHFFFHFGMLNFVGQILRSGNF